jgi:hypothetical protein
MQIAAHEEHFGLERLYAVCEAAYRAGQAVQHRPRDRASVPGRERQLQAHQQPPRLRRAAAAPTLLDHVKNEGGEVIAWARSATSSPPGHLARGQGRRQHGAVRRAAESGRRSRRQVADLRQLRRLRPGLRPPPRRRRLLERAARDGRAPARIHGQAEGRRPGRDHRRPWLRSELARLRPHPRTHPDDLLRPRRRAAQRCRSPTPSPTSAQTLAKHLGVKPLSNGTPCYDPNLDSNATRPSASTSAGSTRSRSTATRPTAAPPAWRTAAR